MSTGGILGSRMGYVIFL
jgi:hypothetical protein